MFTLPASLREFNFLSMVLRIILAAMGGFVMGLGQEKRNRPAGLRTYMLISTGAALAVILELYEYEMLMTGWSDAVLATGLKFDGSRYCASVISGIGFLGAGTILAGAHQRVYGLSTATGLFAAAGMGIAAGSGFYECAVIVIIGVVLIMESTYLLEPIFKRKLRNFTVYVELESMEGLSDVTEEILAQNARIFDINLENPDRKGELYPSAVISLRLSRTGPSRTDMLSSLSELSCIHQIQELTA